MFIWLFFTKSIGSKDPLQIKAKVNFGKIIMLSYDSTIFQTIFEFLLNGDFFVE